MKKIQDLSVAISFVILSLNLNLFCQENLEETRMHNLESAIIKLPTPSFIGSKSVEEALYKRRSIRDYTDEPLTIAEISQVLWAAQGVTEESY